MLKLIHGDCLQAMKEIPDGSVDCVITDPPYDKSTHEGGMFTKEIKFGNVSFKEINVLPIIDEFFRIAKRWIVVFVPVETLGAIKEKYGKRYIRGGIWDRIVNSPQISGDRPAQAVEGIAILHREGKKEWNGGGRAGMWRAMVERGMKQHETQKPIKLMLELVRDFSNEGETICDPFMGSGTTGVACVHTNRNFIGIELDKGYFEIAKNRIETAQLPLL
jgi:site-specific DNA-methyltransferase (adenine-specific)